VTGTLGWPMHPARHNRAAHAADRGARSTTSYRSHDNGNERGEDQSSEMRLAQLGSERYQVSPAAGGGRGPWAASWPIWWNRARSAW